MRFLRLGAVGAVFTGILTAIQGCSESEKVLFLLWLFLLSLFGGGGLDGQTGDGGSSLDLNSGLVGEWKFDEGSGTTALDTSGNGNNGSFFNSSITYVSGVSNTALSLVRGGGDAPYVFIPFGSAYNVSNAITMEIWAKTPSGNQWLFSRDKQGAPDNHVFNVKVSCSVAVEPGCGPLSAFDLLHEGEAIFELRVGGTFSAIYSTGKKANDNSWHHIMGTYDGSEMKIYMDGVLRDNKGQTGAVDTPNSGLTFAVYNPIDAGSSGFPVNMTLDEARIYNRALNAQEVLARCNLTKPAGFTCG